MKDIIHRRAIRVVTRVVTIRKSLYRSVLLLVYIFFADGIAINKNRIGTCKKNQFSSIVVNNIKRMNGTRNIKINFHIPDATKEINYY